MLVPPSSNSYEESARSIGSRAQPTRCCFSIQESYFDRRHRYRRVSTKYANTEEYLSLSLFFSFSFNLEGVAGSHRWKRRFGNSYLLGSRTREREKTNSHWPNSPDKFYPAPSCFTPLLSIPSFLLSFFINFSFPTPSSPPSLSRNFLIISRGENAPLLPVPFHSSLLSFPRRRRKERFADRHLDTVFFIFLAFISFSSPPSPPLVFRPRNFLVAASRICCAEFQRLGFSYSRSIVSGSASRFFCDAAGLSPFVCLFLKFLR